ncbi:hypothetical protein KJV04_004098 [Salmonella enterica]|nr:hypothetical protein [Salmonella enterica]
MYVKENKVFDEYFNELYPPVVFGECSYDAADVLRAIDPVTYEIWAGEYVDSLPKEEEDDDND